MFIRKRAGKDIWQNLYEFVLREDKSRLAIDDTSVLKSSISALLKTDKVEIHHISKEYRQQLTHQTIIGQFIMVKIYGSFISPGDYQMVHKNNLEKYPFPKFITAYLLENTAP